VLDGENETNQGVTIEEEVLNKWETLKGILLSLDSPVSKTPQLTDALGSCLYVCGDPVRNHSARLLAKSMTTR